MTKGTKVTRATKVMRVTRSTRVARLMRMTRVDLDTLVTMATLVTDQGDLREEFVINWPNLVWFPNWPTHLLLGVTPRYMSVGESD